MSHDDSMSPERFEESRTSGCLQGGSEIDHVVAYALGEITDQDRSGFERELGKGNPSLNQALDTALATIAELPAILAPARPPQFAKERVMTRVREEYVEYLIFDEETDRPSAPTSTTSTQPLETEDVERRSAKRYD